VTTDEGAATQLRRGFESSLNLKHRSPSGRFDAVARAEPTLVLLLAHLLHLADSPAIERFVEGDVLHCRRCRRPVPVLLAWHSCGPQCFPILDVG
jgi:hypothetical protein